jgi:hypothetical protein
VGVFQVQFDSYGKKEKQIIHKTIIHFLSKKEKDIRHTYCDDIVAITFPYPQASPYISRTIAVAYNLYMYTGKKTFI